MEMTQFPGTAAILNLGKNGWMLIISHSYATNEGTYKVFPTRESAVQYMHDWSLEQFPEWHKEKCDRCKE